MALHLVSDLWFALVAVNTFLALWGLLICR